MSEVPRLLLVEDEEHLATGIKLNFELDGFRVDVAGTSQEALRLLAGANGYAAILLDVMLPDRDGFQLCAELRESGNFTPVLMLTARDATEDRVAGLEAGADDYLSKPFELSELRARVRSLLRRQGWHRGAEPVASPARVRFGRAEVDFTSGTTRVEGRAIRLTKLELDLLRYFVTSAGRVLSREELQENVWKVRNYSHTRMVDNFIMRLRRHFEQDPARPVHFLSVRGTGYRFVAEAGAPEP